jgi:hypothetical protein
MKNHIGPRPSLHLQVQQGTLRHTIHRPKHQHSIPSTNGRPIRTIKSMAGTIPKNIRKLPTRRLGTMVTNSPVHTQLMAEHHHRTNPIRSPYRLYAANTRQPQPSHQHPRNRTSHGSLKDPTRPRPDINTTRTGNDKEIH